jgi:hypothetical protein
MTEAVIRGHPSDRCFRCGASEKDVQLGYSKFNNGWLCTPCASRGERPDRDPAEGVRRMIEEMDRKLTPYMGTDDFVHAYLVPAGMWHQILAWARNQLALNLAAQVPNQRAVEEAFREAGEVSQASMNYEVRGTASSVPPEEPSEKAKQAAEQAFRAEFPQRYAGLAFALDTALCAAYAVDRAGVPR